MNDTTIKGKVGRPVKSVSFPDGEFTVETLESKTGLSKVTLYKKVKEAMTANVIVACGVVKTKGRPETLFRKNTNTVTTVIASATQPTGVAVP